MIRAVFNMEGSRQSVFEALTDFAHYATWVPGCEKCAILRATPGATDVQIAIKSIKKLELSLRFEYEATHSVRFRMIQGKDIKGYSGNYKLMDSADRKGTVLMAELEIDGGFLAPKFIVDRVATQALRDTGEALKNYVRSLAKQAPPVSAAPAAEGRKKRDRKILSVLRTPSGYTMQLHGKTFLIDDGNRERD